MVDVRNPDRPTLLRPRFDLPGDFIRDTNFLVQGPKIYLTERKRGSATQYGSSVDFSNLDQPMHSPRREVPGVFVAVTAGAAYTHTAADKGFTISRVDWPVGSTQPRAAQTWSGRRFAEALPDESTQRLYILHAPSSSIPGLPERSANWYRLEILDAETLAILSSFDVDISANDLQIEGDTLKVTLSSTTELQLDVRDPTQPKVIGARYLFTSE